VEALIWAQSNSDLEEHAGKDVRQEELLSALSAFDGFFGAWEFTHGKPPIAHSNPYSRRKEDAFQSRSSSVGGKTEACWHRWEWRRHASVFKPGFVTFVGKREPGIWMKDVLRKCSLWGSLPYEKPIR
jgi:hypothetical protein